MMTGERHISFPSPQTTLVILLGASQWPLDRDEFRASDAFVQAARQMRTYFTTVFGVPEPQLLWLFDSELNAIEMGKAISRHLKAFQRCARDVIIYYVGHAKRTIEYRQLYLAIRDTQKDYPERTSVRIENLASILEKQAHAQRRFYILDCCFAANALDDLQGASETDLLYNVFEEVEYQTQGYAALCSSGKLKSSALLPDETNTFFSAALLHVLSETNHHTGSVLSFQDVYEAVNPQLRVLYEQYRSYPNVEYPPEAVIYGKDLARLPLFHQGDIDLSSTPGEKSVEEQALPVQIAQVRGSHLPDPSGTANYTPQPQQRMQMAQPVPAFSGGSPSIAKTRIGPRRLRRWPLISALSILLLAVIFSPLYIWSHVVTSGSMLSTHAETPPIRSATPANFVAFSNNSFSLAYPRGWKHTQNNNNFAFLHSDNITQFVIGLNNNDPSSTAIISDLTGTVLDCTQQNAQQFSSVLVGNQTWQQSIWYCFLDGTIYVAHVLMFVNSRTNSKTAIVYAGWQETINGSQIIHYFDQVNTQYFQPMLQSFRFK